MKVTKIKIKNLFGLSEFEADEKSIELLGANGTGKTSVIDAIKYALTNKSDRDFIVRNGETEGEIIIETDAGLRIQRKSRTNMTDYKSIKDNGKEVASPEGFLGEIFSELQIDPVKFISMSGDEQKKIILGLIEFQWDTNWIVEQFGEIPPGVDYQNHILEVLNDIQGDNGYYFTKRQDINRDIKTKKNYIQETVKNLPENYRADYWRDYSLEKVFTKLEASREHNKKIENAETLKANFDNRLRGFQADKEIAISEMNTKSDGYKNSLENEIARLEEQIKSNKEKLTKISEQKAERMATINAEYEAKVANANADFSANEKYLELQKIDVVPLLEEAQSAEKMKSYLNEYDRMISMNKEISDLQAQSDELTRKIELARTLPEMILKTASLPVEGLSIQDGNPLINGMPVSNLSEGEKLALCIDVAISKPNRLNILLIDGVEKLSTENRQKLYKKCSDKGVQFIATRTTDDTDLNVIEL